MMIRSGMPKKKRAAKKGTLRGEIERAERAQLKKAAAAESAMAHMLRLVRDIEESFYDLALLLREFRNKKMHVALGYPSFEACVEERGLIGSDAAQKLLALADSRVPRDVALAYQSFERTYRALKLTRKTKRPDDSPETLLREKKKIGGVPAERAPIVAYDAAIRDEERKAGVAPKNVSPALREAIATARALHAALAALDDVEAEARAKRGTPPRVLVELTLESARALTARITRRR